MVGFLVRTALVSAATFVLFYAVFDEPPVGYVVLCAAVNSLCTELLVRSARERGGS